MNLLPPPLPGPPKKRIWPIIAAGFGFVVLLAGTAAVTTFVQRMQARNAATQSALHEIEDSAAAAREAMADSLEKGEATGNDEVLGRMKEQLEKSASKMSGDDAAATRAMANYLAKMQIEARGYEAALARLLEANVLNFQISDRAEFEAHRQLVRDFAAANEQLTANVRNAETLARAELAAEKTSSRLTEETMAGFNQGRGQRQMQLRIREQDRVLGEASLGALDLLEKNWGRWSRDETSGQLSFEDDATLESFNALISQIEAAADEQTKVQQELAEQMRTMAPR